MAKTSLPFVVRRAVAVADVFYKIVKEKFGEQSQLYLRFPRNIETLVSYTLELPVISRPNLTLHSAGTYLCIRRAEREKDRPLQGLLHVGPPATMILVEERLSQPARNYIIAHELGHYVHDIFMVQQLWLSSLREQRKAIIQAFSWEDYDPWLELQAMLKGLPDRPSAITKRGEGMSQAARSRENFANAFALELLAPWKEAAKLFQQLPRTEVTRRLRAHYGVPARIAEDYYIDLRRTLLPQQDLFDQLFAPLLNNNIL
jgi:hypothetical protein